MKRKIEEQNQGNINKESEIDEKQIKQSLDNLSIFYQIKKYKEMIQLCDAFQSLDNLSIFYQIKKYKEMIQLCDAFIKINPNHYLVWNHKGNAFRKLNRLFEALKCYESSLELNEQDPMVWNNKGATYFSLNKFVEAIECYERGLKLEDKNQKVWKMKKIAHVKLSQTIEASICEQVVKFLALIDTAKNINDTYTYKNHLWDMYKEARLLAYNNPAKKITFEFLHTYEPNNKEVFEKYGAVLEIQDPKAAKELYSKGFLDSQLFIVSGGRIGAMMSRQENAGISTLTSSALQVVLNNLVLYENKTIALIQK